MTDTAGPTFQPAANRGASIEATKGGGKSGKRSYGRKSGRSKSKRG